MQLSVTQSCSVDGTEPVTQVEDVLLQVLMDSERRKKKLNDFQRKKELTRRKRAAGLIQDDIQDHVVDSKHAKGGVDHVPVDNAAGDGKCSSSKLNLMQTWLTQLYSRYRTSVKKFKKTRSDYDVEGKQRSSPHVSCLQNSS